MDIAWREREVGARRGARARRACSESSHRESIFVDAIRRGSFGFASSHHTIASRWTRLEACVRAAPSTVRKAISMANVGLSGVARDEKVDGREGA
jgi:hypothetical protein